jgi:hypothetical protein
VSTFGFDGTYLARSDSAPGATRAARPAMPSRFMVSALIRIGSDSDRVSSPVSSAACVAT